MKLLVGTAAASVLLLATWRVGAVPTVESIDAAARPMPVTAVLQTGASANNAAAIVDPRGMPEFPSAAADPSQHGHAHGSGRHSIPSPANGDSMLFDKLDVDAPGPLSLALLGIGLLGLGLTRMNGID